MRLLLTPCCAEHYLGKIAEWPGWDDLLVWPEEGKEPLYHYFTRLDDALYQLDPITGAPKLQIYRLAATGVGEREFIAEFAWEGEDVYTGLALARADLPFILEGLS